MVSAGVPTLLPAAFEMLAQRVVDAMQQEAVRYTAQDMAPKIGLDGLLFTSSTDPSNQQTGYQAIWRDARQQRCGSLVINSDGSFYAEYDLFCPHPGDTRWFVEMVTAWGAGDTLRCEAQLIPRT